MNLCIFLALQVLLLVNLIRGSEEEWKCETGTPYQENNCNDCFCTETRAMECTEMGCMGPEYKRLQRCTEVGKSWEKECNKCWCLKDLGTICTAKKC